MDILKQPFQDINKSLYDIHIMDIQVHPIL